MSVDSETKSKLLPVGYKKEFKIILESAIPIVRSSFCYFLACIGITYNKLFKTKILSNFSQTFLPIVSLFFCGHIGADELAGATLACTVLIHFL